MGTVRLLFALAVLVPLAVCATPGRRRGDLAPEEMYVVLPASREVQVLEARARAKCRVVRQLHEGELTLFEAAAWFRSFDSQPEDCPGLAWKHLPGKSVEEKSCRQVISWAVAALRQDGGTNIQAEAAGQRLEKELDEHLQATPARSPTPPW